MIFNEFWDRFKKIWDRLSLFGVSYSKIKLLELN